MKKILLSIILCFSLTPSYLSADFNQTNFESTRKLYHNTRMQVLTIFAEKNTPNWVDYAIGLTFFIPAVLLAFYIISKDLKANKQLDQNYQQILINDLAIQAYQQNQNEAALIILKNNPQS
jgi:hypothetical protein